MNKKTLQFLFLFLGLVLFFNFPIFVLAESPNAADTVKKNPFQFDLYLYFWPAGLDGNVSAENHTAHTSLSFGDIFSDLKMGANGAFKISKGDWFLLNDFIYLDLSHKTSENISSIPGASIDATLDTRVVMDMLAVGRKWQEPFSWNLFAGARYFYGRVRLDAIENLGPAHQEALITKTDEWVTPVVGAGVEFPFNDKLSFSLTADVGAADKSFNWEAIPLFRWKFNERISADMGYRLLDIRHKDNGFKIDTLMHGPIVGMKVSF